MGVSYELMDLESANVVGFFDTADEALATIRDAYARYALGGIEDLALSVKSDLGEGTLLGEGAGLLDLATERAAAPVVG